MDSSLERADFQMWSAQDTLTLACGGRCQIGTSSSQGFWYLTRDLETGDFTRKTREYQEFDRIYIAGFNMTWPNHPQPKYGFHLGFKESQLGCNNTGDLADHGDFTNNNNGDSRDRTGHATTSGDPASFVRQTLQVWGDHRRSKRGFGNLWYGACSCPFHPKRRRFFWRVLSAHLRTPPMWSMQKMRRSSEKQPFESCWSWDSSGQWFGAGYDGYGIGRIGMGCFKFSRRILQGWDGKQVTHSDSQILTVVHSSSRAFQGFVCGGSQSLI